MIASIQGTLAAVSPLAAVVEVNGFGYEVNIPLTTAERLPAPGAAVKLHTLVVYREDAQTLYGFASAEDRDFFRLLIEKVTGIGPKLALGIMSRLSVSMLRAAIATGDVALLAKCPGIGKRTAERLILDLRGQLPAAAGSSAAPDGTSASPDQKLSTPQRDAVMALVALGYKTSEADKVIRQALVSLGPSASTEQLIKNALG
jgi:Holliday junction DNA helicase RuvA